MEAYLKQAIVVIVVMAIVSRVSALNSIVNGSATS